MHKSSTTKSTPPKGALKYTLKRAKQLQEKHNLTASTIRNWKWKGWIPAMYRGGHYVKPIPATPAQLRRLDRYLALDIVVRAHLGLPKQRLKDYLQRNGNARLQVHEVETVFEHIVGLQTPLENFIAEPNFDQLKVILLDPRFRNTALIDPPYREVRWKRGMEFKPAGYRSIRKKARHWLKLLKKK